MNNKQRETIRLLMQYKELFSDAKSLKALLADILPEDKNLRYILQIAYEEGMRNISGDETEVKRTIFECQKVLKEDYVVDGEYADLSIKIWLMVWGYSEEYVEKIFCVEVNEEFHLSKESLNECYLKQAKFYDSIVDIREYLKEHADDIKARYEYISMLFDTLVEPEYIFEEGEAEYIAKLCIESINEIKEGNDFASRYRYLRIKYAQASCKMILGDLIGAYDIFTAITLPMDELAKEMKQIGSLHDFLFRCEINIHQIKELCGIDDGQFFSEYREEIKFFESHVDQILFTYEGAYCLPILIPFARTYRNAFYTVFDNNGDCIQTCGFGGQYFALNQVKMGYSGKYTLKYWPINLYSGVSKEQYAKWTWTTKEKIIDRATLQEHIIRNPYKKINGYLAMLIARNNKRMGRT